ncbi:uncharacterized protein C8A04DRAFT_30717 [Dichotomopilus funicola]|uniref:Uncharacterized protein n=1 Tax=Dichotomopilus funicola TaxID=1934379 RepID=A0AAN6ZKZ8_9PEZI|nr:hypothetical protein C8A04DRAFT_30717 [Dichotomopilus funicola]
MQLTNFLTLAFAATLAVASAVPPELSERACVGNLGYCNKKASSVLGKQCCGGLYCCGVIGANNVCQSHNTCGE